jgi:uncharacterized protein
MTAEVMLLSKESSAVNLIGAWKDGAVRIGDDWISGHTVVSPNAIIREWCVNTPDALALVDLEAALELEPEILIIGTGRRLVIPRTDLMGPLGARGIGVEIMDTPAACRTYNVLAHEWRRVVAALFEPAV